MQNCELIWINWHDSRPATRDGLTAANYGRNRLTVETRSSSFPRVTSARSNYFQLKMIAVMLIKMKSLPRESFPHHRETIKLAVSFFPLTPTTEMASEQQQGAGRRAVTTTRVAGLTLQWRRFHRCLELQVISHPKVDSNRLRVHRFSIHGTCHLDQRNNSL